MDISILLGIIFFMLSVPMGIATNLLTPMLVAYLGRRKLLKFNRTKEQDIATYRAIAAFHNGARDRYATYIQTATLSIISAMGGFMCLGLWITKFGYTRFLSPIPELTYFFLAFLTGGFFALSLIFLLIIVTTARRLERFTEYTAELRKQWGEDFI